MMLALALVVDRPFRIVCLCGPSCNVGYCTFRRGRSNWRCRFLGL